ncbi:MAG: CPXCG motif-containing cysteine-rich protein [Halioglobus sp.]|nr:CPXCG motif-containing cysteine-rich protein [Halioglobus sp.]
MTQLSPQHVSCPYCGESIEVLLDPQEAGQEYIEDCQVCCRPITFSIFESMNGELSVSVHDENDAF